MAPGRAWPITSGCWVWGFRGFMVQGWGLWIRVVGLKLDDGFRIMAATLGFMV